MLRQLTLAVIHQRGLAVVLIAAALFTPIAASVVASVLEGPKV